MSWYETNGRKWPQPAKPTGHEKCENCGIEYTEFSFHLQQGTIMVCGGETSKISCSDASS